MTKPNVLILAAGQGKRLMPISEYYAKPVVPLCGQCALSLVLNRMESVSDRIAVNAHHLADQIKNICDHSKRPEQIFLSVESTLLGTGGAIRHIDSWCNARVAPLMITNADIVSSIDFSALWIEHVKSGASATMLVLDDHVAGSTSIFCDEENSKILGIGKIEVSKNSFDRNSVRRCTYACAMVLDPDLLKSIPVGPGDLWPAIRKAFESSGGVHYCVQEKLYWRDIGTPQSYNETAMELCNLWKQGNFEQLGKIGFVHPEGGGAGGLCLHYKSLD